MESYVIHLNRKCNCACRYCYERNEHSDTEYTWEEVKSFIDNLVKHNKDGCFQIEFLGGEPCLSFDLIKKSVEYFSKLPVDVSGYTITTNGTILNEDIIDFLCINQNVMWAVSMDGTKFANQLRVFRENEENTYDTVIKNLKKLLEAIPENQVSVHIVTHPYNIALLSRSIDHLYNIGIRNIGVGTIESTLQIGREYAERFVKELDVVSQRIIKGKYPGLYIDVLEWLKPRSDVRYYIKDEQGRWLGESYGRTKDDITSTDIYNSYPTSSVIGTLIEDLREEVFNIHQKRKREIHNAGKRLQGDNEVQVSKAGCNS